MQLILVKVKYEGRGEPMTVNQSRQCTSCKYRGTIGGGYSCDYILHKGAPRRSEIGNCDKYKKRKEHRKNEKDLSTAIKN